MTTGLIDVHSHLLPGIDDGCKNIAESLACARRLVEAGYSHSFCTPHIWPSLPKNNAKRIIAAVAALQDEFNRTEIPLNLMPGGELNMGPHLLEGNLEDQPTYGMKGKYLLIDLWCDSLPEYFEETIRAFQALGRTVILGHPERMRAVQDSPELAEYFASLGILMQCNLGCLSDSPRADTRRTAEELLAKEHYFLLGLDLHNPASLASRLEGLKIARQLLGQEKVDQLTRANPAKLMDE